MAEVKGIPAPVPVPIPRFRIASSFKDYVSYPTPEDFADEPYVTTQGFCEFPIPKANYISPEAEQYAKHFWLDTDLDGATEIPEIFRTVIENGKEVKKPANQWNIYFKERPPEGCDRQTYHLNILKQVVGSEAEEVYEGSISDYTMSAILTDEEQDKIKGLDQVKDTELDDEVILLL